MNTITESISEAWERTAEAIKIVITAIGIVILAITLVAALFAGVTYATGPASCDTMTIDIGYSRRWSFWGGCQVEVTEGQWIPLENFVWVDGLEGVGR